MGYCVRTLRQTHFVIIDTDVIIVNYYFCNVLIIVIILFNCASVTISYLHRFIYKENFMSYSLHRKSDYMNDYRVDFRIDINIVEDIFYYYF